MQRYGAATRRFYAAFYQLTVRSANPTRRCVAGFVPSRANSTTSKTISRTEKLRTGNSKNRLQPEDFVRITGLLQNEPVQSKDECPFESLKAWDHVVRERELDSESDSVTVEIAVPGRAWRFNELTKDAGTLGVDIELPEYENGKGEWHLRPVLLSGDPASVKDVWEALYHTQQPQFGATQSTETSGPVPWTYYLTEDEAEQLEVNFCIPESAWQPLAEHECIEFFRLKYDVQTDVLGASEGCTTLRLKGDPKDIRKSTKYLLKFRNPTDDQAQARYTHIQRYARNNLVSSPEPSDQPRSEDGEAVGTGKEEPQISRAKARFNTKIRLKRIYVPKSLEHLFSDPDTSPIARVKELAGLEELRFRPMSGSRYYLQLSGTILAIQRAMSSLGYILLPPHGMKQLVIPEDRFKPEDPTHFAWIRLPSLEIDFPIFLSELKGGLRSNDCLIQVFHRAGKRHLMLRGTEETVDSAIADIQQVIDEHRAEMDLPRAQLEILQKRLIQDIAVFTPWEEEKIPSAPADGGTTPQAMETATPNTENTEAEHQQEEPANGATTPQALETAAHNTENTEAEFRQEDLGYVSLSDGLRSALRHLTQPVALITSTMPAEKGPNLIAQSSPRGVTVSSFCTVTLHPKPMISFNLRVPSRTWDAIQKSKRLSVNLLAASPEGAAVAHAFALPYEKPSEPFTRLKKLGAFIEPLASRHAPPEISWPGAVYTRIEADLSKSKSVHVGDHMIVVARVTHVKHDETLSRSGSGALAYGMRGYRSLGGEIKPIEGEEAPPRVEGVDFAEMKPKERKLAKKKEDPWEKHMESYMEETQKDDPRAAAMPETSERTDPTSQQEDQSPKDLKDIGPSSPILDEESLQEALAETKESYSTKGLPSQTASGNPMLAEALKAAAGAYDESPDAAATSPADSISGKSDVPLDAPAIEKPSKRPEKTSQRPWGIEDKSKPANRTFSTWTRNTTRTYSTTPKTQPPLPKKILQTTVEDYLCQTPTNNRLYNNLIAAQRQAEKLETQLATGKVPASEIAAAELESQATRRRVTRELAWRNAQDLRVLLDSGRVSPERSQWLETSLERGQAVLLHEAKLLREKLEVGEIGREAFEGGKEALMRDYEDFEALLRRLRDFVEEDEGGGGAAGGAGVGEEGEDGDGAEGQGAGRP